MSEPSVEVMWRACHFLSHARQKATRVNNSARGGVGITFQNGKRLVYVEFDEHEDRISFGTTTSNPLATATIESEDDHEWHNKNIELWLR